MHVLGLWFYDLFTNILVIYIYWNLEYLLFIFSIIYNLKRHRKIFLLNLIIAFFCYYSHQRAPESFAVSSRFFELCDFVLAQISNEAQNLAQEKTWDNKLWGFVELINMKTSKSWLLTDSLKLALLFEGPWLHNMKQWST